MPRAVLLWSPLALSLVLAACHAAPLPPPPQVQTPTPCTVALAPQADGDGEIRRLQDQARDAADPRHALEQLGYRYIARARTLNDPGDYTLAEKSAECLEMRQPGEPMALLLRAHVLHQMHKFSEAEALARRLVAMREFVLDYGVLGDALLEQGRVEEAGDAYQKMIDIKPFYQSYVRAGHWRWLKGDVAGALELARLAINAASPRDRESVAWAYTRLSHYELQQGRLEAADRALSTALAHVPDYAAALLARGRVRLAQRRHRDALDTLQTAARLNPLPEYQWTLADALRLNRRDGEAARVEREILERGETDDPRTLALFLATRGHELSRAVVLAERELAVRADVFTHDAHAWALFAAGRPAEAAAAMERALAEGTRDARLFLHAASIADANGRREDARRWRRKADALRYTLLPSELDKLRTPTISTRED
jgi:tetratricopeptide (TPR) repeat protein